MFDSYLRLPRELLDLVDLFLSFSLSPVGSRRPTGAICLRVMEVGGCGARLVVPGPLVARRSGAATTDALRLPSAFGTALSCCAGTDC